jgi:thiol-disulfide isomerase/thioredoxin
MEIFTKMKDSITLDNIKANKVSIIVVFLLLGLFCYVIYYVYVNYAKKYIDPKYVDNKEFVMQDDIRDQVKVADLYFFYADWCPHSKKAFTEWNKLKNQVGTSKINGYQVNFVEVNGEKDTGMADKYKVEGYPTIKLVVNNSIIVYDAKPERTTLVDFLEETLK